ncbi:hypothetical protein ACIBEJ_36990 [Nonomuraea sp. NPDC050790]|uniref:hypothetical protein n=1 Tax=Nonomuraea sp. NPDC050790 TaxID=3364371 RepID=UPI003787A06E
MLVMIWSSTALGVALAGDVDDDRRMVAQAGQRLLELPGRPGPLSSEIAAKLVISTGKDKTAILLSPASSIEIEPAISPVLNWQNSHQPPESRLAGKVCGPGPAWSAAVAEAFRPAGLPWSSADTPAIWTATELSPGRRAPLLDGGVV